MATKTKKTDPNTHRKEVWFCWRERVEMDDGSIRLLTPWSDESVHEFPMDWLFETPEKAVEAMKENEWEDDAREWVLCEEIITVVNDGSKLFPESDEEWTGPIAIKQCPGPVDDGREGSLNTGFDVVVAVLGEPNCEDDPDKVDASWAVTDGKSKLGVWRYKMSKTFSLGGEGNFKALAERLFGYDKIEWH